MTNDQESPEREIAVSSSEHRTTDPGSDTRSDGHGGNHTPDSSDFETKKNRSADGRSYRGEVYSIRVPAGKRTYFFDIKTTRSGEDYFLTITESKRVDDSRYEKHKIFLYKEDFGKFVAAMHEVVAHVRDECLPGYDFRGLPELSVPSDDEDTY